MHYFFAANFILYYAPSFYIYIGGVKERKGQSSARCPRANINMEESTPRTRKDSRVQGLSPGSKLARKRELARLRMTKHREKQRRKKVEASRNILLGPPEEDEDIEGIVPLEEEEDYGAEESLAARQSRAATVRAFLDSFRISNPPVQAEMEDAASNGDDSELIPPAIGPQRAQPESGLEVLARQFALVKCTSYISDNAIEKIFSLIVKNYRLFQELLIKGEISTSYKYSIKPTCLKGIPPIFMAVSLHKVDPDSGEVTTYKERGLKTISNQMLYAKPPYKKLICMEGYVNLSSVVDLHLELHEKKTSPESLSIQLLNSSLSIDGVAESKKGARRFIITTIRFGHCIYLLRILNPLMKDDDAKQSAHDLLR